MFTATHDFGSVSRLQVQALGNPGERTFRLLVESQDSRSAVLWLEKEQVQALGLAIEQLLAEVQGRLATTSAGRAAPTAPVETFPAKPSVEIRVGRLALGQDESELETGPRYVVLVYDLESAGEEQDEPGEQATFACRATREQLRALSRNVAEVVAAGRPRCPMCGEPMESPEQPHGCVRANGYHT